MITDIFAKRYESVLRFNQDAAMGVIGRVLVQAAVIFFEDVQPELRFPDRFFETLNRKLARELALPALNTNTSLSQLHVCSGFLATRYNALVGWDQLQPDYFCKTRLSMLELLFREAEAQLRNGYQPSPLGRLPVDGRKVRAAMPRAIQELNERLRDTGLVYSNGLLHLADDQLTAQRIAKPFWDLVADPKWATVDQEMKEALDHLDHGQRDASAHAAMALESAIKIISDEKGWTTGNEKGAANYIDHLVSAKNGRFIEVWEKDALNALFGELRNPHSHGAGSKPPPRLLDAQQTWAIESCMTWIKSLVRRM